MINDYKRFWGKVSFYRRKQLLLIFFLMLLSSVMEVISIASVVPFLSSFESFQSSENEQSNFLLFVISFIGRIVEVDNIIFLSTILIVLAISLSGTLRIFLLYFQTKFSHELGGELSALVYAQILDQDYDEHIQRNSSETITGITLKSKHMIGGVVMPILNISTSIILGLSMMSMLIYLVPLATAISTIGIIIIYFFVSYLAKNRLNIYSKRLSKGRDAVQKEIQEGLGGIRDIILNNTQEQNINSYIRKDFYLRNASAKVHFIGASPRFALEALAMSLIIVIAFLFSSIDEYKTSIPLLGALALGLMRILPLAQQGYSGWVSMKSSHAILKDVLKLLEINNNIKYIHSEDKIKFDNTIEFKKVSFEYKSRSKLALKNISFKINKGDFIGISGKTGSGKSTLMDLLLGLLNPSEGEILIDNVNLNSKNVISWRNLISHVPQSIFLYDDSLIKNITMEKEENLINKRKFETSLVNSELSDLVNSFTNKENTIVGEDGVFLSGGQKQRIGIARALYKNKNIIVLDEATSALDEKTELKIINSLITQNKNRDYTIIMISHRNSILSFCNKVIKLESGQLVDNNSKNLI